MAGDCSHLKHGLVASKICQVLKSISLIPSCRVNDNQCNFENLHDIWMCLNCGFMACGPADESSSHIHQHLLNKRRHLLCIDLKFFNIWCRLCNKEIHIENSCELLCNTIDGIKNKFWIFAESLEAKTEEADESPKSRISVPEEEVPSDQYFQEYTTSPNYFGNDGFCHCTSCRQAYSELYPLMNQISTLRGDSGDFSLPTEPYKLLLDNCPDIESKATGSKQGVLSDTKNLDGLKKMSPCGQSEFSDITTPRRIVTNTMKPENKIYQLRVRSKVINYQEPDEESFEEEINEEETLELHSGSRDNKAQEDDHDSSIKNSVKYFNNKSIPIKGLKNYGNTCFLNAVIQCLAQTPNLLDVLNSSTEGAPFKLPGDPVKNLPALEGTVTEQGDVAATLARTIKELHTFDSITPVTTKPFINALQKFCPNINFKKQEDAHELLCSIFDALRKEYFLLLRKKIYEATGVRFNKKRDEKANIYYQQAKEISSATCTLLFKGQLINSIYCTNTNKGSDTSEISFALSLAIKAGGKRFTNATGSGFNIDAVADEQPQGEYFTALRKYADAILPTKDLSPSEKKQQRTSHETAMDEDECEVCSVESCLFHFTAPQLLPEFECQFLESKNQEELKDSESRRDEHDSGAVELEEAEHDDEADNGDGLGKTKQRRRNTTKNTRKGRKKIKEHVEIEHSTEKENTEENALAGTRETEEKTCSHIRSTIFSQVPGILIIHLNRYEYNQAAQYTQKINTKVSIPKVLDLTPFCLPECKENGSVLYSLYGVVVHLGTAGQGHYFAYVKVKSSDTPPYERYWLKADDSSICRVTEAEVLDSAVYLAFYQRI